MRRPKFTAGSEEGFFEFMGNLNDKDKVAVVTHTDGDGICSAVIAGKVIGKVDLVEFYGYIPGTFSLIVERLKKTKINKVFIFDLNPSESEMREIEKFAEVLLIDHHPFEKDLNSERMAFIKSDESSATYVCYYLFSKIQKIPEWIAAMGVLSDTTYKYSEDNFDSFFSEHGFERIKNLWKETSDLDMAIIYFRHNEEEVYNLLMKAKNFGETGLEKYSETVRNEFDRQFKLFEQKKEEHGDLTFYYFEPRYNVKTLIINRISTASPHKTIVLSQRMGKENILKVSSRRQDKKIDCSLLLRKSIQGIPNSNGAGHFGAAGGAIPYEYLGNFRENLIREYKKLAG